MKKNIHLSLLDDVLKNNLPYKFYRQGGKNAIWKKLVNSINDL